MRSNTDGTDSCSDDGSCSDGTCVQEESDQMQSSDMAVGQYEYIQFPQAGPLVGGMCTEEIRMMRVAAGRNIGSDS